MNIKLDEIIKNKDSVDSYKLFRSIEDWCCDNIPAGRWRFDYSYTVCVCGVDLPASIYFKIPEDSTAFKLKFKT